MKISNIFFFFKFFKTFSLLSIFFLMYFYFFFQFCSDVRKYSAESLGEIGNGKQEAIDSLIYSLKNDKE